MAINKQYSRTRFRRNSMAILGLFFGSMLIFAAVNTWVNPLWVTPAPWTSDKFADQRQIYRRLRTAKAGLARSHQWDVVYVGSSRVAMGFDPENPHWGDTKVVNLAVSAGKIHESAAIIEYTLKQQKSLQKIILGIDLPDITTDADARPFTDFYESPFYVQGAPFERELQYLAGFSSAEASWKTFQTYKHQKLTPFTRLGHWSRGRSRTPTKDLMENESLPFAVKTARKPGEKVTAKPEKWQALRTALHKCAEYGVALDLFFLPDHAVYFGAYSVVNDPDPFFQADRRAVFDLIQETRRKYPDAAEITLWDFSGFYPPNCEPIPQDGSDAYYWIDGTHSRETLGDIMLARMEGWPLSDPDQANYGIQVTPENIDSLEAQKREGLMRYQQEHQADWAWAEKITKQAHKNREKSDNARD